MRIALLHPTRWPQVRRGGERYLHDLGWWLTSRGHAVDIVTGGFRAAVEHDESGRLVTLRHRHPAALQRRGIVGLDTFGLPAAWWLARHRYDVVHALVPTAAIAAAVTGQRVVYTALGHPGPLQGGARRKDTLLFRQAARRARTVTALSGSAARAVEDVAGVAARVVPPGLRTARFPLAADARTGPPRILFNADARDHRKRLPVLLAAMPAVLAAHPDTRLVLGGGGAVPPGTPARVAGAVVDLGVGKLHDVAARYQQATVTVLPSVNEAFGLVLVESLACGTPVVGTRSGGIPEIVDDPSVGRLCDPDDPTSLSDAVIAAIALAADPGTPRRCAGHAGRWDWDVVGPLHEQAYAEAAR